MNKLENAIKEGADAFVPSVTETYGQKITETVGELRTKAECSPSRRRTLWRALPAAAAVIAALVISAAAVFAARPALAAEVPIVNEIVYSVSPEKAADEGERERIASLAAELFRAFAARDYDSAEACFRDGAMHTRETYLAAAYTDMTLEFRDSLPDNADVGEIEIAGLASERRAFRYTCRLTLNFLSRDGSASHPEECIVRIWENAEGMHVESIEMQSDSYKAFVEKYEEVLGPVPKGGTSFSMIPLAYRCLYFDAVNGNRAGARQREDYYNHMLGELDAINAPAEDKAVPYSLIRAELDRAEAEITPAMVSIEDIAAELMYRYWLGGKTGEVSDFADILEHNGATDLFFWDAMLQAETLIPSVYGRLDTVERGKAQILETTENTDGTVTARLFVQTDISSGIMRGVGEDIILTLRKGEEGLTVTGFDRDVGDGIYIYTLKPLAEKYKAEGYSWQEAGRLAYEAALAELG